MYHVKTKIPKSPKSKPKIPRVNSVDFSVGLIWLTLALSFGLALSSYLGVTGKWPKVFYVSCVSNAMVLALFYAPSMYGYHYYFVNLLRTVPLILWLVYLARKDPSPTWVYRAMCLVLILQIVTGGWHILSSLGSPYYDQLALAATVLELIIITVGGYNVRLSVMGRRYSSTGRPARCSVWARRNHQSRG